jgi:hypothetical protein
MEGKEVDREVSPPILKREREEEQPDSPLWVTGELGSPTVKPPHFPEKILVSPLSPIPFPFS